MQENLNSDAQRAEALNSQGNDGISTSVGIGNSKLFRYDNIETVKKHINNVVRLGGSGKVIRGIKNLKIVAGETDETKPQLRKGQIIFVSDSI